MVTVPPLPEVNLLSSLRSWSAEDRHQARVLFRRLRMQIALVAEESQSTESLTTLRSLNDLAGTMLTDIGEIRDLDVLEETYRQYVQAAGSSAMEVAWNARKARLIAKASKAWPLSRRSRLAELIQWFLVERDQKKLLTVEGLEGAVAAHLRAMFRRKLKSKEDWHWFRRKLRRVNYLKEILGEGKKVMIALQKDLGTLQDLERLGKECPGNQVRRRWEKKLRRKTQNFYSRFREKYKEAMKAAKKKNPG